MTPSVTRKRAGANVVRDHLERVAAQILRAGFARRRLDEVLKEIDVVVRVHALHHGGNTLEPHAGIDRRFRQRMQLAVLVAVVLHEDEVPDLDEAVTVGIFRARRSAFDLGTVVVENLRARTAGARVAHLPEVVHRRNAGDALCRYADLVQPDVRGLVVLRVHGDPELLGRNLQFVDEKLPRVLDRVTFKVVTEAEIAEHLEERVMPRRVAHVLQIVVLAAGAQAALAARRAAVGDACPVRERHP